MKTVVITGGSSGIGLSAANEIAKTCKVYELSRREATYDDRVHIRTDVSDEKSVRSAIKQVIEAEGKIDILVCCAGFGISGAVEFTDEADARRQLDVNFYGVDNTVRAVLPYMREAGGGRIVCVSSVAGAIPIPFQTYYSVSKAAINAYVKALDLEVKPFGISACAVMPGDIRTGFTAARKKSYEGDDIYDGRISRSVAGMEKDEINGGTPDFAGKFIAKKAFAKRVPAVCTIGLKYKFLVLLARTLPQQFVLKIVGMLYAK